MPTTQQQFARYVELAEIMCSLIVRSTGGVADGEPSTHELLASSITLPDGRRTSVGQLTQGDLAAILSNMEYPQGDSAG
jgi:hypothetical protein